MHTSSSILYSQGPRASAPELASFHVKPARRPGAGVPRRVCIETAHSDRHRHGANRLLQQRYSWRGYRAVSLPQPGAGDHLPLTASRDGVVIGTLTVGFDSPRGLNCDRSFAREVQALRAAGQRLCEFTKLAVQADEGSVQVLAALFHVAFIAARKLQRVDTVLLEVNPRHVRYYQRMLGAEIVGEERANSSVDAPAVLLAIPSAYIRAQIDQTMWPERPQDTVRSLYTQAFNRAEESAIVARLMADLQAQSADAQAWRQVGGTADPRAAPAVAKRPFTFRLPAAADSNALAG